MIQYDHKLNYKFTNDWFNYTSDIIENCILFSLSKPSKILEIGSYEGKSTCFFIDYISNKRNLELHCIDTWGGGVEHSDINMSEVEQRFLHNTKLSTSNAKHKVDFYVHKGTSDYHLSKLIVDNKQNYFDLIYIDGSHQAPDVLCDAVLSFRLLKIGGIIVFDDYLWFENTADQKDLLRCPKLAIDSFINLYWRKIEILNGTPLYQMYIRKISE